MTTKLKTERYPSTELTLSTVSRPLIHITLIPRPQRTNQDKHKGVKTPHLLMPLGLIIALAAGCSQQNSEFEPEPSSVEAEYVSREQAALEIEEDSMSQSTSNIPVTQEDSPAALTIENLSATSQQTLSSQAADSNITGKKLLVTASVTFKAEDVIKSSAAIETLAYQQGGYVASKTISNRERDSRFFVEGDKSITVISYDREAEMVVRIPKAHVNKFLTQLQQQVTFLTEQSFTAQDVTLDIYREQLASNLNSELASELNKQRLESRDGADQSSNVEAITATYTARQQQEYAQLEQMNIADRVKYSTITLSFTQPDISYKETMQNLDLIIKAERPSFGSQVSEAFKQGWDILRDVTITLIKSWWLIVLAGIFYVLYRMIKTVYRRVFSSKSGPNSSKRPIKRQPENKGFTNNRRDD